MPENRLILTIIKFSIGPVDRAMVLGVTKQKKYFDRKYVFLDDESCDSSGTAQCNAQRKSSSANSERFMDQEIYQIGT